MIVLGLETASPSGGVAVMDEHRVLGSMSISNSQAHSRLVLPSVERILTESKLTIDDVDIVASSSGPGSFTGVRVGLTLAKALCLGPQKPKLILVPTLEALAQRAMTFGNYDVILPLLNAMRGEVYGAVFRPHKSGIVVRDSPDFVCAPDELGDKFTGRALVAGEGFLAYRDVIEKRLENRLVLATTDRMHPSAEQVALLGREAAKQERFEDPATAAPIYLRDASTSIPKKKPPRIVG